MTELSFLQSGKIRGILDRAKIIDFLALRLPTDLRDEFVTKANQSADDLNAFLVEKRTELIQRIPEDARFLVQNLKDFNEESFDLIDLSDEEGFPAGKLAVTANASILLDRIDLGQLQGDVGFTLTDDDVLLKLQISGNLNGSAELKGTGAALTIGFNFAAGTQQRLNYFVAADRNQFVAEVIPELRDFIVDPANLTNVVAALDSTGLVRIERSGNSTTNLGFTVGISQQINELIRGQPVTGGAGLSLSLEYQDVADFSLIVDRNGPNEYVIDFRKTRRKTRSSVLKLGIDVKIIGFKNKLIDQIALAIPEDDELQALLRKLDEVTGKLSKDALSSTLKSELRTKWRKGKPVFAFLVGEQTADELAAEIRDELQQKIEEAINVKVDLLNSAVDTAARTVATQISDELGLAGEHRSKLDEYIGGAVSNAIESFRSKIDGEVNTLIGEPDFAELLRPWEFVGENISRALTALSAGATDAVERTRRALESIHERYTQFRQGILEAVSNKMEEEFSISVISEKERTVTNTRTVRLEFREPDQAVEDLHKALWTGDLRDFNTLVAAVEASPSTVKISGEYLSVATRLRELKVNVNFFGLKVGSRDLFADTVQVGIDLNNRLIIAKSKAELIDLRTRSREQQLINTTWQVDYLRTEVLSAPLLIKVVLTDEKFKSGDEVEDFFLPLEQTAVMRTGVSTEVETTLFTSSVQAIPNATLSLNVMLRWQEWLKVVGSDRFGQPVPEPWQPDAVCRKFLRNVELAAPVYPARTRELMRQTGDQDTLAFLLELGSIRSRSRAARSVGQDPRGTSRVFGPAWRLARVVADLHSGLTSLQANWKTLGLKLADLEPIGEDELQELQSEIQTINDSFSRAFGRALSTGLRLDDPGEISWLTASTLNLFSSMADNTNPFLTCTFESERTGRLIFS